MQETLQIKIKKQYEGVPTPSYAKAGDAGLDLTATEIHVTDNYIACKTGIAVAIPEGYVGLLFPRSSISNKSLSLANSVGVIDSGYRDEIEVRFRNLFPLVEANQYKVGDRIAQLVIIPYPKIEIHVINDLPQEGNRGGGYGSTGN